MSISTAAAPRSAVRWPASRWTTARGVGPVLAWYAQRTYGDVPDNGLALLHDKPMLRAVLGFERRVARWDRLDPDLKVLAQMASAARIGCSWCLDFGYFAAHSQGLRVDKIKEVPRWRDSDVFTPVERGCWSTPRR